MKYLTLAGYGVSMNVDGGRMLLEIYLACFPFSTPEGIPIVRDR